MKNKILYLLMVLLIASCGSNKTSGISSDVSKAAASSKITVQSVLSNMDKGTYKAGELLVKFKSGIAASSPLRSHQAVGAQTIRRYSVVSNLEHVKLPAGVSVRDAITKYMNDPNVEYAEPNYIRCASLTPDDPFFVNHQQWALYNTGQYAGGTPGADINARQAWDVTTGLLNNPVKIAVLDSGIDVNHPDLVNNIWRNPVENCSFGTDDDGDGLVGDCRGWNFVDGTNDVSDDIGHGTHVAGIIGAATNNGLGTAGVMWHTQIIPLKIFDVNSDVVTGSCISAFVSDEISAIQFAIGHGARVINASFRSEGFCASEFNAIGAAGNAGILFVASAGNGGLASVGNNNDLDPQYPASYGLNNIISVAATDQNDRLATFSNFGPLTVDVAAPGVFILSTVPFTGMANSFSSLCTGSFDAGYDFCSGTSMAAPHVSGLAGLLFGYYPQLTVDQVRQTIIDYVDTENESPNLHTLTGKILSNGRINAFRALASLLQPTDLTATAISSSQISINWKDNAIDEFEYKVERKGPADADFVVIAFLPADSTSFTDSGLAASTSYSYRVKVINRAQADSFPSDPASATTLSSGSTPPPVTTSSDGGGGCSIGTRQNAPTALADLGILLMPLLIMAVLRRKR